MHTRILRTRGQFKYGYFMQWQHVESITHPSREADTQQCIMLIVLVILLLECLVSIISVCIAASDGWWLWCW